MVHACQKNDTACLTQWCIQLLALRESHELRMEEQQRGQAMATLLQGLCGALTEEEQQLISRCQLAGFAKAITLWHIPIHDAVSGYLWSWLENQVIAGIKIIPLGQTQGHRILSRLDESIRQAVDLGLALPDKEIGASNPALAIASSRHETQYTRLYRS
jgi:urease accessory protein